MRNSSSLTRTFIMGTYRRTTGPSTLARAIGRSRVGDAVVHTHLSVSRRLPSRHLVVARRPHLPRRYLAMAHLTQGHSTLPHRYLAVTRLPHRQRHSTLRRHLVVTHPPPPPVTCGGPPHPGAFHPPPASILRSPAPAPVPASTFRLRTPSHRTCAYIRARAWS